MKLDSGFRRNDDRRWTSPSFVTLTKVRAQLWVAASWIRGFRRNHEGGGRVMRGLDPRICRLHQIAGSSPAMTLRAQGSWIPAFAGMTMKSIRRNDHRRWTSPSFVTLTKVRVQLGAVKLDQRLSPE